MCDTREEFQTFIQQLSGYFTVTYDKLMDKQNIIDEQSLEISSLKQNQCFYINQNEEKIAENKHLNEIISQKDDEINCLKKQNLLLKQSNDELTNEIDEVKQECKKKIDSFSFATSQFTPPVHLPAQPTKLFSLSNFTIL